MLFPMEKVFEAFVTAKLRHQLPFWRVSDQAKGKALVDDHRGSRMFNLIPDLLFTQQPRKLIGDTKWKLIDSSNRGKKYGISQSDIYQLFGYSRKYLKEQHFREVLLIYPRSDTFREPLKPFWYTEETEVLYVVPYDLDNEKLILPEDSQLTQDYAQVAS